MTLAITDPKDPNWIISTFVTGGPRTVTKDMPVSTSTARRASFHSCLNFVPSERYIDCSILTKRQNVASVWIDDIPFHQRTLGNQPLVFTVPEERQWVHFNAGWNRIFARVYAAGYDLKFGLILHDTPARLWGIKQSPMPPTAFNERLTATVGRH